MLNQLEIQFEGYMAAMYGNITISEEQERDLEKTFYAGMVVMHSMMTGLDDEEDIAFTQLDKISEQLHNKAESLL